MTKQNQVTRNHEIIFNNQNLLRTIEIRFDKAVLIIKSGRTIADPVQKVIIISRIITPTDTTPDDVTN